MILKRSRPFSIPNPRGVAFGEALLVETEDELLEGLELSSLWGRSRSEVIVTVVAIAIVGCYLVHVNPS